MFVLKTSPDMYGRNAMRHATKRDHLTDTRGNALESVVSSGVAYTYEPPSNIGEPARRYTSNPVFDYLGQHGPDDVWAEIRDDTLFAIAGDVLMRIPEYRGRPPGLYRVRNDSAGGLFLRPTTATPPAGPSTEFTAASTALQDVKRSGAHACDTFLFETRNRFKHGIRVPGGVVFDLGAVHRAQTNASGSPPDDPLNERNPPFDVCEGVPYLRIGDDVIVRALSPEYGARADRAIDVPALQRTTQSVPTTRLSPAVLAKPPVRQEDKRALVLAGLRRGSIAALREVVAHATYARHPDKAVGAKPRNAEKQTADFFSHARCEQESLPRLMRSLTASNGWLYMSDGASIQRIRTVLEDGHYEYLPEQKEILPYAGTRATVEDGLLGEMFAAAEPTSDWNTVCLHRDAAVYNAPYCGLVAHVPDVGLFPYWMLRLVAISKQEAELDVRAGCLSMPHPEGGEDPWRSPVALIRSEDREMLLMPSTSAEIEEELLAEDRERLGSALQPLQEPEDSFSL